MTPEQMYALSQIRMAETRAQAQHSRLTAGRRPAPLWRSLWARRPRTADRTMPAAPVPAELSSQS